MTSVIPETSFLKKLLGVELNEVSALEKFVAALGGGLSILLLFAFTLWALPDSGATSIVASMGASAVLLFAVPHGQLSQPWPVVGGHVISASIGVACAKSIGQPHLAAACAVGLAIWAMHQFKCIHPPGGATAFTAVLGGEAVRSLGYGFVLFPVLTNAVAMVLLSVLLNFLFPWRRYPSAFNRPADPTSLPLSPAPSHDEVVRALKSLDSFVDVSEEDLLRLTERLSRGNDKSAPK